MSLPSSVVHLDLSNNGLFEFPLLSSATRHTLKYLILSSNRISQFPRDVSFSLQYLQKQSWIWDDLQQDFSVVPRKFCYKSPHSQK